MPTVSAIELLLGQLEDLHHAETQLGVSMHSLSSVASHPGLRHMMVRHLGEIERQKERIAQILTHHGRRLYAGRSVEIEALVDAARKRLETAPDVETVDLVLVIGCIRIDHYEMGSYEVAAAAISDWIFEHVAYQSGSSDETSSAVDTLEKRQGVCRDFAHLAVGFCRAMNIPARYVSVYADLLQPPDFHAVFEVFVGGMWYVLDPTRLAPLNGFVRIATGRDAADVSVATVFGNSAFQSSVVSCVAVDAEYQHITRDTLADAGQAIALL